MHILFDIGATKTRIALKRTARTFGPVAIVPTPRDPQDAIRAFSEISEDLAGGKPILSATGGVPGPFVDALRRSMRPTNISHWGVVDEKFLRTAFSARRAVFENDASLGALGEAHFGAGKGKRIVAYLTVSTGVGGARVVRGALDSSASGFEPGKQIVDWKTGETLEDRVSGTAFPRRFKKHPATTHTKAVWKGLARELAAGAVNAIVHWSPDVLVLGGSMMNAVGIPIPEVIRQVRVLLRNQPIPRIVHAKLGDVSGLYGALVLSNGK